MPEVPATDNKRGEYGELLTNREEYRGNGTCCIQSEERREITLPFCVLVKQNADYTISPHRFDDLSSRVWSIAPNNGDSVRLSKLTNCSLQRRIVWRATDNRTGHPTLCEIDGEQLETPKMGAESESRSSTLDNIGNVVMPSNRDLFSTSGRRTGKSPPNQEFAKTLADLSKDLFRECRYFSVGDEWAKLLRCGVCELNLFDRYPLISGAESADKCSAA